MSELDPKLPAHLLTLMAPKISLSLSKYPLEVKLKQSQQKFAICENNWTGKGGQSSGGIYIVKQLLQTETL